MITATTTYIHATMHGGYRPRAARGRLRENTTTCSCTCWLAGWLAEQEHSEPGLRAGLASRALLCCGQIPLSAATVGKPHCAGRRWDSDPPAWLELPEGFPEQEGRLTRPSSRHSPICSEPNLTMPGLRASVAVTGTAQDRLSICNGYSFPGSLTV